MRFLSDVWRFLKTRKSYWLIPFLLTLAILGVLMLLGQNAVVTQFVYPLF